MKMAPMSLLWWLPTTVTLGFLLLETAQGLVLEMAVALLALLMGQLRLVSVSYMTSLCIESSLFSVITCPPLPIPSNGSVTYNHFTTDENDNYAFDVVATYNCDTGFSLVGNNSTSCTGNGSSITGAFDGLVPICEGRLFMHGHSF